MLKGDGKTYTSVCGETGHILRFTGMDRQINVKSNMHDIFLTSYIIQTLARCKTLNKYREHVKNFLKLLHINVYVKHSITEALTHETIVKHVEYLKTKKADDDSDSDFEVGLLDRKHCNFVFIPVQQPDQIELDDNDGFDVHVIEQARFDGLKEKHRVWKETRCVIKSRTDTMMSYYMHPKAPLLLVSYIRNEFIALSIYQVPINHIATIYLPLEQDNILGVIDSSINTTGKLFAAAITTDIYVVDFGGTGEYKIHVEHGDINCIRFSSTNADILHVGTRQGHIYSIRVPDGSIIFQAAVPNITPVFDIYGSNYGYMVANCGYEVAVFDHINGTQSLSSTKASVIDSIIVGEYVYLLFRDGDIMGIPVVKDDSLTVRLLKHDLNTLVLGYEEWYRAMRYDEKTKKLSVMYPDGQWKLYTIKE